VLHEITLSRPSRLVMMERCKAGSTAGALGTAAAALPFLPAGAIAARWSLEGKKRKEQGSGKEVRETRHWTEEAERKQ
jgi:hypothetical protein